MRCNFLSSGSIVHNNNHNNNDDNGGDEDYVEEGAGMELFLKSRRIIEEEIPSLQKRQEELNVSDQWNAAVNASEKSKSKRSAGVAVVKTIAKQSRQNLKTNVGSSSWSENSSTATATETLEEEMDRLRLVADECMERAAMEYSNPLAYVALGNKALLEDRDVHRAMEFYAKADNGEGWFNIGHLHWAGYEYNDGDGISLPVDEVKALQAFQNALQRNDADAAYFLGVHLMEDEDDFAPKRAAFEQVFPDLFLIRNDSSDGSGEDNQQSVSRRRQDYGLHLVTLAGIKEHPEALYYLALLHLNGNTDVGIKGYSSTQNHSGKDSSPRYMIYLEEALIARSADAFFLRATLYFHGENGYSQSYKLALRDFEKSSELGNSDGAVSAGAMYHQGIGDISQNQRKGFDFYQQAGDMGNVEGWRNVAACYVTGEGVPKCESTAKHIYNTMVLENDLAEQLEGKDSSAD